MSGPGRAAAAVDEARLWHRHVTMAAYGARDDGGVDRQALSAADIAARRQIITWATDLDLTCLTDDIGNLYVRMAGSETHAAPVMTGSHLDSQPTGGKYDGTYGVLAGIEALHAMRDAGITPVRPIEAVAWTNEEGSRFQPGCMGSGVMTGSLDLADILRQQDWDGVTVAAALAQTVAALPPLAIRRPVPPLAYIEAHIEQGPILEREGLVIGAVTGIQGAHRFMVTVTGAEAHAGTTPRGDRKDALMAAVAMVTALDEVIGQADTIVRFTVGRFEVTPGSPNTVAGQVTFSIDLRHPDGLTLAALSSRIEPVCLKAAGRCAVTVTQVSATPTARFDPEMVSLVRDQADRLGLGKMEIMSGAGHDAVYFADKCPTAMIFVPCAGGVSHHPSESATPGDLAAGCRVLAACLAELAGAD